MVKLLLIADDFTGTLDTSVQFSKTGIRTFVSTQDDFDLSNVKNDIEVLAVSTNSRHNTPDVAKKKVKRLVDEAIKHGIQYIYKKTDSAMRGNIGAELEQFAEQTENKVVAYIPAYPAIDRLTVRGVQMVDGVPVNLSRFADDLFSPVKGSCVKDIIGCQSDIKVTCCAPGELPQKEGIHVYDCENYEQLINIGQTLNSAGRLYMTAGCAGFASVLPQFIHIERKMEKNHIGVKRLLVISGSVSAATMDQLKYIQKKGVGIFALSPELKLELKGLEMFETKVEQAMRKDNMAVIATAFDKKQVEETLSYAQNRGIESDIKERIMSNIGCIARKAVERNNVDGILVIGGDTLEGIIHAFECNGIIPMGELSSATVYGSFICKDRTMTLISKSGGLGELDVIWRTVLSCMQQTYTTSDVV